MQLNEMQKWMLWTFSQVALCMVSENNVLTTDHLTAILLNHVKGLFLSSLSTSEYEEAEQV